VKIRTISSGDRETCPACGATVTRDSHGTYVDETGGDVCTERGDDAPHLGERTS